VHQHQQRRRGVQHRDVLDRDAEASAPRAASLPQEVQHLGTVEAAAIRHDHREAGGEGRFKAGRAILRGGAEHRLEDAVQRDDLGGAGGFGVSHGSARTS
jgi:hypothetical protein